VILEVFIGAFLAIQLSSLLIYLMFCYQNGKIKKEERIVDNDLFEILDQHALESIIRKNLDKAEAN